jgi:hypothetical protein
VENQRVRLVYTTRAGVALRQLADLRTGHQYLPAGKRPAFRFRVHDGHAVVAGDSIDGILVEQRGPDDARRFAVTVRLREAAVRLRFTAALGPLSTAACLTVAAENLGERPLLMELVAPLAAGFALPGAAEHGALGMVPIELGSVATLDDGVPLTNAGLFQREGFVVAANAFEAATVYSGNGGGLFLSGDGGARQSFSASRHALSCHCTLELEPGGTQVAPTARLGIHDGDWRAAVDEHLTARRAPAPVATPDWLRLGGAIYNPLAEGGGGIYQVEPTVSLAARISSFAQLPGLLEEARAFDASILHLFDFWEGAPGAAHPPYWNKGDYVPRADLGGEVALAAGVEAVHAAGGRILLYLEPFIVYRHSELGRRVGERWGMRDACTGELLHPYEENYSMVSWFVPWQDLLVEIAERFVRDYGADGIFLDSWGWQWNYPCTNAATGRVGTAADWNRGVLDIIDRVRSAVRAIRSDAVVVCESFSAELAGHADAGLDATFAWSATVNRDRLPTAPVRYAFPYITVFSAGRNLAELHQVFAAGTGLALGHRWLGDAPYLRRLVQLRRRCADALIEGRPVYQPVAESTEVFAYCHRGRLSEVVTVVNAGRAPYEGVVRLERASAGREYRELLTGRAHLATSTAELVVTVPPGGLLILDRR